MKALVSENKLTEKSRVGYSKQFLMQQVGHSQEESVTGLKLRDFGRWRLAGPTCCRYSTSAIGHFPERPFMADCTRRDFRPERQLPVCKGAVQLQVRITALAAYPVA